MEQVLGLNSKNQYDENIKNPPSDDSYPITVKKVDTFVSTFFYCYGNCKVLTVACILQ